MTKDTFTTEKNPNIETLVSLAYSLGASEAKCINPADISTEDSLARLCREPRCKNYGMAPSCPPHVSGPEGFKKMQDHANYAIVIRFTLPSSVLFSAERSQAMQHLHETIAEIEKAAIEAGFRTSNGFAGGSCKQIFCADHTDCPVLEEDAPCRFPDAAKPSMSGFGINVSRLMKTCGWPSKINVQKRGDGQDDLSWIAGLVLLG